MLRALYTAASGMEAQQLNIDTIAHNLANINTSGYKQRRLQFQDLLYQDLRDAGTSNTASTEIPVGLQIGLGTIPIASTMIFTQGDYSATKNPLDIVIEGQGFFQVTQPNGELAYTRCGNFHLDRDGSLVTAQGDMLDPQITIPEDQIGIMIGADGTVSVLQAGATKPTQVGTLQLVNFINPTGLQSAGENLYLETASSGTPSANTPGTNGLGRLSPGNVETSNVNVVEEMVSMIQTQRAYEINSKAIQTSDQMLQRLSQL